MRSLNVTRKSFAITLSLLLGAATFFAAGYAPTAAAKESRKYVALTLGLTQEEQVPNMPAQLSDDLSYNRNIVKISIARELKAIRFEPVAIGTTNFTLRDASGHKIVEYVVSVRKNNLNKVANDIKNLLNDVEGINIRIVNNKVVIDGEVLTPRDMNRIYTVVNQFPDVASQMVTMSPLAQKKIAEQIERDIGNPEIHCRAVNEKFILEGVAGSEAEKQKAEILAKTYVPDVVVEAAESAGLVKKRKVDSVINLLTVKAGPEPQPAKTIKIIVHFVELGKDYGKAFRFQWTPSLADGSGVQFSTGTGQIGGAVATITGTVNDLLPKLNFAKNHGHARVLQSTSIIVQDGYPGIIKNLTKYPYTVLNQYGVADTKTVDTGIDTTITPNITNAKSDNINLIVNFNISSVVGMTEKIPITSASTIQTRVSVRSNQSAAIGGLVSNKTNMDYNKLPAGTSDNPILSLYASRQFQRNQSQFVVFITPVIMNSASEGSDEVKRKFRLKE